MAARTPTPCGSRAALLLRLQTDAGLACAELHPRGALILAGGEQGDLLVFATSNGNLLQVASGARAQLVHPPPPPPLPTTAAAARPHSIALPPCRSGWRTLLPSRHPSLVWPGRTSRAWSTWWPATRTAACASGASTAPPVSGGSPSRQQAGACSYCTPASHPSPPPSFRGYLLFAVVASLAAHRSDVGVLAVMAPLALLATGGADGNIKLWGMPAPEAGSQHLEKPLVLKEPRQKLKGHAGELTALHFTPDGEQLISGDSCGGLRVWEVAGGAPKAGRLAHNLSGHHSGTVSGLACHPDERLFVSCSADRTLRVWDMDGPVPRWVLRGLEGGLVGDSSYRDTSCWCLPYLPLLLLLMQALCSWVPSLTTYSLPVLAPHSCINTHGPEGRREPRAVAFTPGGRALLAAYPDGLRTFTLDPLQLCDNADGLQWGKVSFRRDIAMSNWRSSQEHATPSLAVVVFQHSITACCWLLASSPHPPPALESVLVGAIHPLP